MPFTAQITAEGVGIVFLDVNGNGTAFVGPISARETWTPVNAHVSVSTNTNEATCTIYAGDSPTQSNFRDATFTGSSGDVTDKIGADQLKPPQKIYAVWTGGDPGSQAIIKVTGTKLI